MGRFASAKANSTDTTILQRMINYLIDLLDKEYSITTNIGGKEIKITINGTIGLEITVDGVKQFGVATSGYVYATRIGTPTNEKVYAVLGETVDGFGIELWNEDRSVTDPWLAIRETVAGGTEFYDLNNKLRFKIGDTGYSYIADEDGYVRYANYTDGKTEIYSGGPGQNKLGVDGTGVYKEPAGGPKTYL